MKGKIKLKEYSSFTVFIYSLLLIFSKNTFVIDTFKKRVDSSKKILELGSGTGREFYELSKYYNITGSDYSDAFLKKLKKRFKQYNFPKINALTMEIDERFDIIYSNKVLQHLLPDQLKESLKQQYNTLNSEGLLIHAMWKGDPVIPRPGKLPDVIYEKSDIEKIKGKFIIEDYTEYSEIKENDSFIIVLKKQE